VRRNGNSNRLRKLSVGEIRVGERPKKKLDVIINCIPC